jgi:hypothetical protein
MVLFSDTSAAAVTCAIMKPEFTPLFSTKKAGRPLILGSTSTATPLRQAADLRQRERQRVGGEGHGLGVKVSARQHVALFDEQQRIVGDGIGLEAEGDAAIANQVQARAHHLRLAAERIGILHARAIQVRGANGAAGDQVTVLARHGDLPGLAANFVNAIIEGRVAALQGIHRHGAGDDRGGEHIFGAEESRQGQRRGYLGAVDQRQTFLGAQLEGASPAASGPRPRAARLPRTRTWPMPSNTVLMCARAPDLRMRPPSPARESPDRLRARAARAGRRSPPW